MSARELVEVEHHRVHEVTAYHAQRQGDEHEHVRCVSVQRWRCQYAAEVQCLQPEVRDGPQLHYRRERFGPNHRQSVEHAQHLEEGHQLAAHCGKQCKAVPPLCTAVTLHHAVDAPQKYQCDDHSANQESHVGTTARLRICRDVTYQRNATWC